MEKIIDFFRLNFIKVLKCGYLTEHKKFKFLKHFTNH